jgi:hypothetical protein
MVLALLSLYFHMPQQEITDILCGSRRVVIHNLALMVLMIMRLGVLRTSWDAVTKTQVSTPTGHLAAIPTTSQYLIQTLKTL